MPVLLNGHLVKNPPKSKRGERQISKRGERPPLNGQKYPQVVNALTPHTPKNCHSSIRNLREAKLTVLCLATYKRGEAQAVKQSVNTMK